MGGPDLSRLPDPKWETWNPRAQGNPAQPGQKPGTPSGNQATIQGQPAQQTAKQKRIARWTAKNPWTPGAKTTAAQPTQPAATPTENTMPNQFDWGSMFQQYYPEYGQTQAFNYPEEMDWVSDVLGEYVYIGRSTSYSDWYQTAK